MFRSRDAASTMFRAAQETGVRQRARRNGAPVSLQRTANRMQRTVQAVPLRQEVHSNSVSEVSRAGAGPETSFPGWHAQAGRSRFRRILRRQTRTWTSMRAVSPFEIQGLPQL